MFSIASRKRKPLPRYTVTQALVVVLVWRPFLHRNRTANSQNEPNNGRGAICAGPTPQCLGSQAKPSWPPAPQRSPRPRGVSALVSRFGILGLLSPQHHSIHRPSARVCGRSRAIFTPLPPSRSAGLYLTSSPHPPPAPFIKRTLSSPACRRAHLSLLPCVVCTGKAAELAFTTLSGHCRC